MIDVVDFDDSPHILAPTEARCMILLSIGWDSDQRTKGVRVRTKLPARNARYVTPASCSRSAHADEDILIVRSSIAVLALVFYLRQRARYDLVRPFAVDMQLNVVSATNGSVDDFARYSRPKRARTMAGRRGARNPYARALPASGAGTAVLARSSIDVSRRLRNSRRVAPSLHQISTRTEGHCIAFPRSSCTQAP